MSRDTTKFAFGLLLIFLSSLFLNAAAMAGTISICGAVYHGTNQFARVGLAIVAAIAAVLLVMLVISVMRTAAHHERSNAKYEGQALVQEV